MEDFCCECVAMKFDGTDQLECTTSAGQVTEAQIKENIRIIEIHRSFVYALGKTVYPEYDFIAHDLSKFSSTELIPYTIKFVLKAPDSQNPGWEKALQHHYLHNPHHPQYWGDKSMPEEFLKESIVDMAAAQYQYKCQKETLPEFITKEMFKFDPVYLKRYNDADRKKVEDEIKRLEGIDWTKRPISKITFHKA